MSFEFNEAQNQAFAALARSMRVVGLAQLVIGGLLGLLSAAALFRQSFDFAVGYIVQGILLALVGSWTLGASRHVTKIVETQEDDIGHLMSAVHELSKLYRLQRALLVIAIVLAAAGILLLMYQSR